MSKPQASGTGLALLTSIVPTFGYPIPLWLRAVGVVAGVILLFWPFVPWIYLRLFGGSARRPSFWSLIVTPALLIIISAVTWLFWPIQVYQTFQIPYHHVGDLLGRPTKEPLDALAAEQIIHEDGIIIYLKNPGISYVIARNHPKQLVDRILDPEMQSQWDSDEAVRIKLCPIIKKLCTSSCLPPVGGGVQYYLKNPDKWLLIGCRDWGTGFTSGQVYSQQFENGVMVGIVRSAEKGSTQGQIYIIYKDNTFDIMNVGDKLLEPTTPFYGKR